MQNIWLFLRDIFDWFTKALNIGQYKSASLYLVWILNERSRIECIVRMLPLVVLSTPSHTAYAAKFNDSNVMSTAWYINANLPDTSFQINHLPVILSEKFDTKILKNRIDKFTKLRLTTSVNVI